MIADKHSKLLHGGFLMMTCFSSIAPKHLGEFQQNGQISFHSSTTLFVRETNKTSQMYVSFNNNWLCYRLYLHHYLKTISPPIVLIIRCHLQKRRLLTQQTTYRIYNNHSCVRRKIRESHKKKLRVLGFVRTSNCSVYDRWEVDAKRLNSWYQDSVLRKSRNGSQTIQYHLAILEVKECQA